MKRLSKRVQYKETIHCPLSTLGIISLASTLAIDIFVCIFVGNPKLTMEAITWVAAFSGVVFLISFSYGWLRYSVKLKVFRSAMDKVVYLSLRGVGKGTWLQIPVEWIVSCAQTTYSGPWKGFITLLLSSNVPFTQNGASLYPLPGYRGLGIHIKYRSDPGSKGETRTLIIPTTNPAALCELLSGRA